MLDIEEKSRKDLILENIALSHDKNQLEKELEDVQLELSTPLTAECAIKKDTLYKWAALIVCEGLRLEEEIKRMKSNADNTIREIEGDNAPDGLVDPVYSLSVMALGLQTRNNQMREFIEETDNSEAFKQWCNCNSKGEQDEKK